jgi:hypothetical protein
MLWSESEVAEWLRRLGYESCVPNFEVVNGVVLMNLDSEQV